MRNRRRLAAIAASTLCSLGVAGSAGAAEPPVELAYNPFDAPGLVTRVGSGRGLSETPKWTRALKGTLVSGSTSIANMDGTLVAVGEVYEGFTLMTVGEGTATFRKDGSSWELKVEDDTDEDDDVQ